MARWHRWAPLKKASVCSVCTARAFWSRYLIEDGSNEGVKHYCDFCKQSAPSVRTEHPKLHSRKLNNDYGRANNDQQSLTQSSIPRWAEKIRTREKK